MLLLNDVPRAAVAVGRGLRILLKSALWEVGSLSTAVILQKVAELDPVSCMLKLRTNRMPICAEKKGDRQSRTNGAP